MWKRYIAHVKRVFQCLYLQYVFFDVPRLSNLRFMNEIETCRCRVKRVLSYHGQGVCLPTTRKFDLVTFNFKLTFYFTVTVVTVR